MAGDFGARGWGLGGGDESGGAWTARAFCRQSVGLAPLLRQVGAVRVMVSRRGIPRGRVRAVRARGDARAAL